MAITLTPDLVDEYEELFEGCQINGNRITAVDKIIANIIKNQSRYETVAKNVGKMPWFFLAVIHNMEASLNFTKHLHNGDALTAKTVHVPAGYPKSGKPPFTWEFSAEDALKLKKLDTWQDWSISGILFQLERYNGFGYRLHYPDINTPYLWSFSSQYVKGKYVADGKFDVNAVSQQCGAATLLRRMLDRKIISIA